MRIVVDTNAVLSALLWRGTPHHLLATIGQRSSIQLYSTTALLVQLGSGLAFKHFAYLELSVSGPVEALARGTQDVEPGDAILVVQTDMLTAIAPGGDVVEAAGMCGTKRTGNGAECTSEMLECKT